MISLAATLHPWTCRDWHPDTDGGWLCRRAAADVEFRLSERPPVPSRWTAEEREQEERRRASDDAEIERPPVDPDRHNREIVAAEIETWDGPPVDPLREAAETVSRAFAPETASDFGKEPGTVNTHLWPYQVAALTALREACWPGSTPTPLASPAAPRSDPDAVLVAPDRLAVALSFVNKSLSVHEQAAAILDAIRETDEAFRAAAPRPEGQLTETKEWSAIVDVAVRQERERAFEAGRATGTVEGWADWTNEPHPEGPTRERLAEIVSDSLAATTEGTDYAEAPEPSDEPGSPYVLRLTNEILARLSTSEEEHRANPS